MSDVTELVAQLRHQQVEVRAAAAEQLCHMGPEAQAAAAALVEATGDEEPVREWAVAALEDLGPPAVAAIPELVALTAAAQELVSYWAITLLGRLGTAARGAESALTAVLRSSSAAGARQRAVWALGQVGVRSAETTELLQQASQSSDPRLAQLARQALAHRDGPGPSDGGRLPGTNTAH